MAKLTVADRFAQFSSLPQVLYDTRRTIECSFESHRPNVIARGGLSSIRGRGRSQVERDGTWVILQRGFFQHSLSTQPGSNEISTERHNNLYSSPLATLHPRPHPRPAATPRPKPSSRPWQEFTCEMLTVSLTANDLITSLPFFCFLFASYVMDRPWFPVSLCSPSR